jgi:hypothetical protein
VLVEGTLCLSVVVRRQVRKNAKAENVTTTTDRDYRPRRPATWRTSGTKVLVEPVSPSLLDRRAVRR